MHNQQTYIEWVPFLVAPDVSTDAVLAAADTLQREFLSSAPGCLRRTLWQRADGGYVDCVEWRSRADYESAMAAAMAHPAAQQFFALLADPDAAARETQHFTALARWTSSPDSGTIP
ncbi:MAG: antibiotic biosynthesis monooxygenase [Gemmatimonadaceae bacterium]|nr:antibiotic biosynthesis monooxygenase [Gemmatimonadaceae bacterium]